MHVRQPKVALIAILLQHSELCSPSSCHHVLAILAIEKRFLPVDVVSSCTRRRCAYQLATVVKFSHMLHYFHKDKQPNFLFLFMTLLALSSEVTCLQEIQSKFPSSGTDNIVFEAEFHSDKADGHPVDFCVDSDGVRHGIFSSWRDSSTGCQCSCQSVGNVLVSLCDESCEHMLGKMENDNHILLSQNDEPFASLVYKGAASRQTSKSTPKAEKAPDKSCRDENSGSRYLDGQSWMSNVRPCAKCYCVNGTADCESSVLHCQSSCLPGQKSVSTGPCCDHVCIGQPITSDKTALIASCDSPVGQHGEVVIIHQQCVDQRCQCINGNWFCIDTCTPLEEMKCPPEERIFWDPFCCPRCKGEKSCTVTVATVNWLDKVPNRKGLPRFVSIFTPEGEEEILSEAHQPQILRPSMYEDDEANRNEEKTSIITVSPAQHLVTHAGRCVCTDGELRCFRPGPGIWHDTDCYYSHGQHGRYYAKGEHWKSYNDECSDCYCLEGRKYTCSRTPCSSLFLCPSGKVPVFAPGDCCPSTCEDKKQVADEENSYQLPDQAFIRRVPESAQNSSDSPVAISSGGKCRPLGALVSSHNATSNVMLPSNSLVIIRRTCVSLKCVCSSEGNWVCGDYCIPCHGLPTLDGAATSLIDPVNLRTSDGCCPKCSATADREETLNFGDRYSVAITCFLALLVLTPLFVITSCCICLRYRRKLKKLRATEPKQAKFLLESGLPTHSAQSSLAVPLTISTNAEGPSTQTSLDKEPVVLSRRDSMHHPLLPTAKITDTPLSQIKFWQLSASHTCLTEVHNAPASASSEQNRSRIFEDSTPPNSPLTSSDHILKTDHDSDVSLTRQAGDATTCTSSPVSSSSPQLGKAGSTTSVGAQDTLTWRPRLRRSSTQPRTHFFPHAWKAMISKSAATTPMRDHETTPFFDTRNTSPPNLPIPEDLYELEEQCQSPPTPNSHDDHAQNSMAIDLAAISEVV